jgi:Flp pilus assembly protein TadG
MRTDFRTLARHFARDINGNMAIAMALVAVPLFGAAGMAVDFANKSQVEARMQAAVDAGTLAGASMRRATDKDVRKAIRQYARQNNVSQYLVDDASITIRIRNDGTIDVQAIGKVETTLSRVLGVETMDVQVFAQAKRGDGGAEVALVLDNTASMEANNKIGSLRTAASQFVAELLEANIGSNPDTVRISVVPYAQYVNVGLDKLGQSWLHVEPDQTVTFTDCRIPGTMRYDTNAGDGTSVEVWDYYTDRSLCTQTTYVRTWHGCVGSREYPYNTEDSRPDIRFVGPRHAYCPTEITPLTSHSGTLQSAIGSMSTNFYQDVNTYIPSGLSWGWRTLSSGAPYTEAVSDQVADSRGVRKHIVLMTDGVNTVAKQTLPNLSYPLEGTTTPENTDREWQSRNDRFGPGVREEADRITAELCTNIKSEGITIHAVAFDVTDSGTRDLLRNCASTPGHYYDAGDSEQLSSAFYSIAGSIQSVHLAK